MYDYTYVLYQVYRRPSNKLLFRGYKLKCIKYFEYDCTWLSRSLTRHARFVKEMRGVFGDLISIEDENVKFNDVGGRARQ